MPNVPYIGFGSDELEKMAPVRETATCPGCGQSHTVEYGDEVKKLHIEKNKPSVSGSIPLEEDIAPSA